MFAPKGYISLAELWNKLWRVANDWCDHNPHPGEATGETPDEHSWEPSPRRTGLQKWLLESFLEREQDNLYVSTSSGTAMKISPSVVHRCFLLCGPFQDEPKAWDHYANFEYDEYIMFDFPSFMVSAINSRKHLPEDYLRAFKYIEELPICWKLPDGSLDLLRVCAPDGLIMPGENSSGPKGGRPKHPAYHWYETRDFLRMGLTLKELQSIMPADGSGRKPSETTIRDWERDYFQRKPLRKPPQKVISGFP